MAPRGRPRVTEEALKARIDDYCARYDVAPNEKGLPPFPAGRRETRQHREWITLVKAHTRLRRRMGGLCRRCDNPAAPGGILCEEHESLAAATNAPADSKASCFVCGDGAAGTAVQELQGDTRSTPELVHRGCADVIALTQRVGPELLDRVRQYLWPDTSPRSRRRPPRR